MEPIPQEFQNVPVSSRPYPYWTQEYKYPMTMRIEMFREYCAPMQQFPIPTNYSHLHNHKPVGKVFLELYPGAAAFQCKQYVWIENKSFDAEEYQHLMPALTLMEEFPQPHAYWIDPYYVEEEETFIPGYRDGFGGPVTSYYVRVNALNPYFS